MIFDCSNYNKVQRIIKKKLQVNLKGRLIEMMSVFNSINSGLVLVTDQG